MMYLSLRKFFLFVCWILLAACNSATPKAWAGVLPDQIEIYPKKELDDDQVKHPTFMRRLGLTPPYWEPDAVQVRDIDEKLRAAIGGGGNYNKTVFDNYADYYRRYVGYTKGGAKKILIQGQCKKRGPWGELTLFYDGGACYFTARFNLEKKKFEEVFVHGES